MSPLLEAEDLGVAFGGRPVVEGVSLVVAPGDVVVVVGPNGAGKTSLTKLLTGELSPSRGTIRLDGEPLAGIAPWRLAARRAVMAQASRLAFPFSVAEVVRIGVDGVGRALPRGRREAIIGESLAAADIGHLVGRSYQTLSGGEQQRVQFARTYAQLRAGRVETTRQMLFLDEPVASLDLAHQIALMESAAHLASEGVGVVAVLHDLNLAATFADRILVMSAGRCHAFGPPAEVVTRATVRDVFGVDLCREGPAGGLPVVLPQHRAAYAATAAAS